MKKIFLFVVAALSAIMVDAQKQRDGHFFKTFTDTQVTVQAAPEVFSQWFTLPEGTEWREVSRQTDNIGMERIEYRQYISGFEVEYSQVLLHARDGRVQSANGTVMELKRVPLMHTADVPVGTPTTMTGKSIYSGNLTRIYICQGKKQIIK